MYVEYLMPVLSPTSTAGQISCVLLDDVILRINKATYIASCMLPCHNRYEVCREVAVEFVTVIEASKCVTVEDENRFHISLRLRRGTGVLTYQ